MLYRYARSAAGNLIDVLDLEPDQRRCYGQLACLGCGHELIPVLGIRRERHFRHKQDETGSCSRETYLHATAKRTFVEAFETACSESKPFTLTLRIKRECDRWKSELGFVCNRTDTCRQYDLTKHFDKAEVEVSGNGFVADILLSSSHSDETLLVEIKVTHACEPEKLASGLRIAEVEVANESEVKLLADGLSEFCPRTKLHNFREQDAEKLPCTPDCGSTVAAFHVFESGKALMKTDHPSRVAEVQRRRSTVYSRRIRRASYGNDAYVFGPMFREEALRAIRQGISVKACSICRYASFAAVEKAVFCKLWGKEVSNGEAASCLKYCPGQSRSSHFHESKLILEKR